MTNDDRDSVNSNLAMGTHVALLWATKELAGLKLPHPRKRRMLILTVRAAAKELQLDVQRARRLAACHASGLRTLGVKVALLLALAAPAVAQGVVYTNYVNGQRIDAIVRVERPTTPAAPVPSSIVTTEVLPRNYHAPLGPSTYLPTTRSNWGETSVSRPTKQEQPLFINGVYVGASPSGNWTSTVIGRPIVDVNIVGTPRRQR